MTTMISEDFHFPSHYVEINGSRMHYVDQGIGDPILFLHGMPGSCYVWRNVIPHLSKLGRCIAPDLIGLGKSDKPDIEYSIFDHIHYIEKFIATLNLSRITFVLHGWGSLVGFDYAMRNEKNCKGLAFYESFLHPFLGEDVSLPLIEQLHLLDQKENVYDLLLDGKYYIDNILPQEMMRSLTPKEKNYYSEPFSAETAGRPLQRYLRELPRKNQASRINEFIAQYSKKLKASSMPKLLLYSIPGYITTIETVVWAKENLPHLEVVDVGEELHYAQESNPDLMGEAISIWLQGIEQFK